MQLGEEELRLLLFADDIVLFAESGERLQEMLRVLEEYCKKWRFEINVKKSKVMVCGWNAGLQGEEGGGSMGEQRWNECQSTSMWEWW